MSQGTDTFHTVVIGSGSGGLTVAVGLSKLGKRVALVEAKAVGGDCTNVGCVPSKTLIHLVTHPGDRSPAEILATVQEKRNRLRDRETEEVREMDLTFLEGRARFLGPERLAVALTAGGTREIGAQNIVIATGAKPAVIPIDGLPEARTLTNESLFELPHKPEHLAIIGSGVVGSEMAFAFRKLGSRVSMVSRSPRVLSASEPEASAVVGEAMTEGGIDLYLNAEPDAYDEATQTLWLRGGGERVALGGVDKVLLAVGRVPATKDLGLETTGVTFGDKGIPADAYGATNVKGIYAIGDVNPASSYTHSANAQGRRVVRRLAFPYLPAWGEEPLYPNATFTDPEVAAIGPSLAELGRRYHPALLKTVRADLAETDKGYTEGLERGFVLIHAVRLTGRVLGATVVAPRASEMISLLTAAVYNGLSLYKLSGLVFPYPVLSEGIKKAADAFVFETLPKLPREGRTYLRYRWAGLPTPGETPEASRPHRGRPQPNSN